MCVVEFLFLVLQMKILNLMISLGLDTNFLNQKGKFRIPVSTFGLNCILRELGNAESQSVARLWVGALDFRSNRERDDVQDLSYHYEYGLRNVINETLTGQVDACRGSYTLWAKPSVQLLLPNTPA